MLARNDILEGYRTTCPHNTRNQKGTKAFPNFGHALRPSLAALDQARGLDCSMDWNPTRTWPQNTSRALFIKLRKGIEGSFLARKSHICAKTCFFIQSELCRAKLFYRTLAVWPDHHLKRWDHRKFGNFNIVKKSFSEIIWACVRVFRYFSDYWFWGTLQQTPTPT